MADGKASDTNAPSQSTPDVIVDMVGEQMDEIGENESLKKELKDFGRALSGK